MDRIKPKFDVRKSMACLLDILSKTYVKDARGIETCILSEKQRMQVINAGMVRSYKRRTEYKENADDGSTEYLLAAIKKCGDKGMAIDPLNHKTSSRINDLKLKGKIYEPKHGVFVAVKEDYNEPGAT